jgi:diaminopimelate decarboxylase
MKQKNLKKITYLEYKDLIKLSKTYGQSFFILDSEKFRKNYIKFSKAFKSHYPKICIGYSYKTNYTPHLCQIVNQEGGYAEIASEMEYEAAKKIGVPIKKIIYNGPNKSKKSFIEAARKGSIINLDNANEISFLKTAARINLKNKIKIVLRINFDIGKKISRFGFDPEGKEFNIILSQIRDLPNVSLVGLHCHFPFRDLKSFNLRAQKLSSLIKVIFPKKLPEIINIGGGYYSENIPTKLVKSKLKYSDYAKVIGKVLSKKFSKEKKWPTLFLEPGPALVSDCQIFCTRVNSVKKVRGIGFATVAGSVIDISPNTRSSKLPVQAVLNPNVKRNKFHSTYNIVGYTCIESDYLTHNFNAPLLEGDFVVYSNVGSYSVVMRPPFILPSNPILLYQGKKRPLKLIKKRQSKKDVFRLFKYS